MFLSLVEASPLRIFSLLLKFAPGPENTSAISSFLGVRAYAKREREISIPDADQKDRSSGNETV